VRTEPPIWQYSWGALGRGDTRIGGGPPG